MSSFFKNFFVLIIIAGIITRLFYFFLAKKLEPKLSAHIASFLTLVITGPIVVVALGFDVAIAEYIVAIMLWWFVDLLWVEYKKKG